MATRQQAPQNTNNFAASLNHVQRSSSRLNSGPAQSAARQAEPGMTQLQQDIINNKLTPHSKTAATKTEQQLRLIHQKMADLSAELTPLAKNNKPFSDRALLNEAQNRELMYALKCSTYEDAELGELYQSVLSEEINIMSAEKKEGPGHSRSTPLSAGEQRVLHKTILERKLDILDFCAKVLRLHEQAEWVSPAGYQAVSVDKMVDNTLANASAKPLFTTPHGIDRYFGLYHESQYDGSGTCVLHANNHYLASWCEREGKPFLPLTPRRMEMLLSGLEQRVNTEIDELSTQFLQSGKKPKVVLKKIEKLLTGGEKNILKQRDKLIKYSQMEVGNKTINTASSGMLSRFDTTAKINQLYSLPTRVSTHTRQFSHWKKHLDEVEKLEREQDSIRCSFFPTWKVGHAICFTKKNNQWYMQDSNVVTPMKARPSDFIRYICGDKIDPSTQATFDSCDYRNCYSLTAKGSVNFHHYEPKDIH